MPKIAEIEYTPNPNAVKFLLKESIVKDFLKTFLRLKCLRLILWPKVYLRWVMFCQFTCRINGSLSRRTTTPPGPTSYPNSRPPFVLSKSAIRQSTLPSRVASDLYDPNDPILQKVQAVLNETILPALASDGGGLEVVGRHEKQILIRYQGACGTCPSSLTGTLAAIENLIHQKIDPELTVVSV